MNGRTIGIIVAGLAIAGLLGFYLLARPSGTGDVDTPERVQPRPNTKSATPKSKPPPRPVRPLTSVKEVAPVAKPVTDGETPVIELADQPDLPIDPMDHYPLNKQGFEAAWNEMQIEFDACRNERGVKVPDQNKIRLTVKRESPPHEEYGIEEGEMWGMVKKVEVIGEDPEAMKPFTDCVQDNLYDLLFTPPTQDQVHVELGMEFK